MAEFSLKHDMIPDGVANLDLWTMVQSLFQERRGLCTDLRWIPSPLSREMAEDPFEDWLIHWNDAVDRLAVSTNRARSF